MHTKRTVAHELSDRQTIAFRGFGAMRRTYQHVQRAIPKGCQSHFLSDRSKELWILYVPELSSCGPTMLFFSFFSDGEIEMKRNMGQSLVSRRFVGFDLIAKSLSLRSCGLVRNQAQLLRRYVRSHRKFGFYKL